MKYMVNKNFGCIDVIYKNGLFRKKNNGDCIFKSMDGQIDKFTRTNNMTDEEYDEEFNNFCKKYNIDWKNILELLK